MKPLFSKVVFIHGRAHPIYCPLFCKSPHSRSVFDKWNRHHHRHNCTPSYSVSPFVENNGTGIIGIDRCAVNGLSVVGTFGDLSVFVLTVQFFQDFSFCRCNRPLSLQIILFRIFNRVASRNL